MGKAETSKNLAKVDLSCYLTIFFFHIVGILDSDRVDSIYV